MCLDYDILIYIHDYILFWAVRLGYELPRPWCLRTRTGCLSGAQRVPKAVVLCATQVAWVVCGSCGRFLTGCSGCSSRVQRLALLVVRWAVCVVCLGSRLAFGSCHLVAFFLVSSAASPTLYRVPLEVFLWIHTSSVATFSLSFFVCRK